MLVSRQHDSEQNHWSMSKYETIYHKPASSPRMSHHYDAPLSTQPDWQGQQYSFLPPGENPTYPQTYGHGQPASGSVGGQAEPRTAADASGAMDLDAKSDANSLSPALSQRQQPSPNADKAQNQGELYAAKAAESASEAPAVPADAKAARNRSASSPGERRSEDQVCKQEEEDDVIDDDDMDGDVDGITAEMTPAERTAARRKMKRFRYDRRGVPYPLSCLLLANPPPDLPTSKRDSS